MRFKRKKRSEPSAWLIGAGVVLTGAVTAYAISRLMKAGPVARRRDMHQLEKRVLQALLEDEVATNQGIDIGAIGSGIIELSGVVSTQDDARHVIGLVDRVPGVRAVVNRMQVEEQESRLKRNRGRNSASGTRWYGGNVGTGRRRQGMENEPPRRDDHRALLARSLRPNRDDTLTDVEETENNGVRIGVSRAGPFTTDVPPRSPDERSDRPGPPPPVEI